MTRRHGIFSRAFLLLVLSLGLGLAGCEGDDGAAGRDGVDGVDGQDGADVLYGGGGNDLLRGLGQRVCDAGKVLIGLLARDGDAALARGRHQRA